MVSDKSFSSSTFQIVEIPEEFSGIDSDDLIANFKFRDGKFTSKTLPKSASNLRVAFVGNWKMRCGIATYSENLWPEVIKQVGDYRLFIEKNEITTGDIYQIGDEVVERDKVISCWKRGESLLELVSEIKKYQPDIVWIQHEFGLWPNACYWLSMMNQFSEFRVIVTMHSIFHHKDKTICEAAMPEIVVHLEGAKKVLKNEKQIPGTVHLIPHGCYKYDGGEKLWNFYKSDQTFMQFGFGFRYKGWELSIKAAGILKKKYNNIFFTGIFSESPFCEVEHEIYYNELMELVSELGLEENVAIIRGYQSDTTLNSYLKTNQVTVFPYISHPSHEVFGVSGAARLAMSKGLPVITTSVNHFSDLPTIKADTAESIAEELDLIFSNPQAKQIQLAKQLSYLQENTWESIAKKYLDVFESIKK